MGIVLPLLLIRKENYLQKTRISKNHQPEMERMAESEISTNWNVFVPIDGREIEEKVESTVPW